MLMICQVRPAAGVYTVPRRQQKQLQLLWYVWQPLARLNERCVGLGCPKGGAAGLIVGMVVLRATLQQLTADGAEPWCGANAGV
jgi:hypothetical protein